MSSIKPIRDPKTDHLLTPENSALLVIDYQPIQVHSIASMDRRELVENISNVCRVAKGFNVPVILTTVNVATGLNQPTIPQIKKALPGQPEIDRTSVNSWEDKEFSRKQSRHWAERNLWFVRYGQRSVSVFQPWIF